MSESERVNMELLANPCDWQITKQKLSERGKYLFDNPQWSDCSFRVGTADYNQTVFHCHKLILAMSSPVFEAMLFGGMAEKTYPIEVLDVQPDAFKVLLEYIYSDNIAPESFDQACELCYAAKKYMLPYVVKKCTEYIWHDLEPKNVCRAYEFAHLFEEPILLQRCIKLIEDCTSEVITDSSFEDITPATLEMITKMDKLNIKCEQEIINASIRWAHKEVERKSLSNTTSGIREALGTIVANLRFLTLSPSQFAVNSAITDFLTRDESFAILMNLSSPGSMQLPDTISPNTQHRFYTEIELDLKTFNRNYLCQRSFLEEDLFNNSTLDCTTIFSVDRKICILGIQIPSQKHPPISLSQQKQDPDYIMRGIKSCSSCMTTSSTSNELTYSELIYAQLLDSDNSRITYTHFTGRVKYGKLIDIHFNRPVYIQKNKEYKVCVALSKSGTYLGGVCDTHLIFTAGTTFDFNTNNRHPERDSIIRSIIFNKNQNEFIQDNFRSPFLG